MALNLEVNILGEFRNLTKATKGATKQLQGFEKSAKRISRGITTALAAIGAGISFNALKNGIQGAVAEASNLEQAYGAAAAVFKDSSDTIIASSKAAATAYGLSANQYLQSANLIGAQLSNLGFTQAEYTKQTQELVELGADLAATFGGTAYDAVQALSAVFRGEYNQVERYGVSIRKSDINARLAAKGQDKLTGEMLKQAEALAALEILYGQTEAAQGQFSRESGTLAGATQILQASMANAKIEIGEGFYPVVAAVTKFLNDNIDVFTNLADAVGNKVRQAFEGSGDSAQNFAGKIILALTDLTDFLNGEAGPENAFSKASAAAEPFFEVLGALGELGKGLLAVLNGLFEGLFGFLAFFIPGADKIGGFAGVIEFLGLKLQEFGEFLGLVASFFIPFTAGLKVGTKIVGFFTGTLTKLGNVGKGVTNAIQNMGLRFRDASDFIVKALNFLQTSANPILRGIGQLFSLTIGPAITLVRGLGNFIGNRLPNALSKFMNNPVVQAFKGVIDFIVGGIRTIVGANMGIPANGSDRRFQNMPRVTNTTPPNPYANGQKPDYLRVIEEQTAAFKSGIGSDLPTIPELVLPEITTPEAESEFVKGIKRMIETIEEAVKDAQQRIRDGIENFRDNVQLSFGIITNGAFAVFDVNRVIRQMQRIKDSAATFAEDIAKLQEQGADTDLISQLLGMDPISGATAARGLLSSGRLDEFLKLRQELADIGGSAAEAANLGIYGQSTDDLVNTLDRLNRLIENGVENVYNITVNNAANMSAKDIVDAIRSYESSVGKKVFSN